MSYYSPQVGDYKTYGYAGDPGFLSSLWKGIKTVGKSLLGIPPKPLPPTPPIFGPVAAATGSALALQQFAGPGGARGPSMPGFQFPSSAGMKFLPGPAGPTRGSVMPSNGCCPVGYHMVKTGAGYCVRNRRMNIANPRALRRGMRRVQGFEKLAKRTISFTRRVKMKKRSSS